LKLIGIAVLTTIFVVSSSVMGQTRRRSTSRPSTTRTTAAQRTAQVRTEGATRIAEQIKHLTRFTYLLGGINSSIALADEDIRRNQASPEQVQTNERSKATVRSSIQGFREILDKLEIDFRATPELQPYYIRLAGSAAGAATAEEQAAKNQFDAAGRTLLNVVNRLTDVLLAMRG
jgi:hypothetical protein